jgi:CubicO group peptidase (beta-lactamase class C family)
MFRLFSIAFILATSCSFLATTSVFADVIATNKTHEKLEQFVEIKLQIDALVNNAMSTFQVPGVAIGVIKNNQIIHLKGYGLNSIEQQELVNKETIFKIASNTKAFTSAALAILVDAGKINWNDPVVKYLPNFKMYDPWVTKEFNIRDLLTHRSGLRVGAGDLMLWPEPTKFTRQDIINNLQYLKPVASFRDVYAYDNLLYIVAGELIAKVSGTPWEDYIAENIFKPLNMNRCYAGGIEKSLQKNMVVPHAVVEGQLTVLKENLINHKNSIMAAAGGVKCSVSDLMKWTKTQLNHGLIDFNHKLYSKKQSQQMWKPVTTLPITSSNKKLDKMTYRAYALGWRVSDYFGHQRVSHTGALGGSLSQIILLPDLKTGIVILTNQQSSDALNSLAKGLSQLLTHSVFKSIDWVDYYHKMRMAKNKSKKTKKQSKLVNRNEKNISNSDYQNKLLGSYYDQWFGKIIIERVDEDVVFKSIKSPRMVGKLYAHGEKKWWVKWNDRSFEADAWLTFNVTWDDAQLATKQGSKSTTEPKTEKITLTMKAISSATDFSFDFADLKFTKQVN